MMKDLYFSAYQEKYAIYLCPLFSLRSMIDEFCHRQLFLLLSQNFIILPVNWKIVFKVLIIPHQLWGCLFNIISPFSCFSTLPKAAKKVKQGRKNFSRLNNKKKLERVYIEKLFTLKLFAYVPFTSFITGLPFNVKFKPYAWNDEKVSQIYKSQGTHVCTLRC